MSVAVSGMRPTGRLHLGNYWGALKNWVELQSGYQCYFFVADWHALTTGYEDTKGIAQDTREMVLDWLAAGLDPERCVLFRQSQVPEHAELALLLSMITPMGWLLRNPTYKEQLQELYKERFAGRERESPETLGDDDRQRWWAATTAVQMAEAVAVQPLGEAAKKMAELNTHGFLGYPVLQAADILVYKGEAVPVGQDQVPHLELTQQIAQRFNGLYGRVFPEPRALLTPTPKVPGLDGRKMSKSYGNTVELAEPGGSLAAKVMAMYTDPLKARKHDKGNPDGCVVFATHRLYTDGWRTVENECREGQRGCVDCKMELTLNLAPALGALRERREALAAKRGYVNRLLDEGARRARAVAHGTLDEVREAMGLA